MDKHKQESLAFFRQTIEQVVEFPQAEWDFLAPQLSLRAFPRQAFLVMAGDISREFYFITAGLVRFYYATPAGKEFNKHFAMRGNFAGSMLSLVSGKACQHYIQALEDTETVVLPHRAIMAGYQRHPCWERLGRYNAEQLLLTKERREKELLLDSLEQRYLRLLHEYPGLVERLPQYHIASFLGVTDVALSRLRRKLKS